GGRADQGPEDPHPPLQEQDRLPPPAGAPSAADPAQGHRHQRQVRNGTLWLTRRARPARATAATPTRSSSASSASAASRSRRARSSSGSAAPSSTRAPVSAAART